MKKGGGVRMSYLNAASFARMHPSAVVGRLFAARLFVTPSTVARSFAARVFLTTSFVAPSFVGEGAP